MKDVPIYAKMIKELYSKEPRRKLKDPPTIHVTGNFSDIMLGKTILVKYGDPRNMNLTVQINGVDISNVLVDLGAVINVITSTILLNLGLLNLKPMSTVLEFADRSIVGPIGKLEDVTYSVDSWEYPIDLLVLHTQSLVGGHPLILGRSWLTRIDAYIGCR